MLDSVELGSDRFMPGDTVTMVFRWRALQPVNDAYTVFQHLFGPGNVLIDQDDHSPRVGDVTLPTNSWTPGVIVRDRHTVGIPPNATGGAYQLRAGMYLSSNASLRLPVLNPGRTSHENSSILIKEISVGQ
jgi:hypothetical protein